MNSEDDEYSGNQNLLYICTTCRSCLSTLRNIQHPVRKSKHRTRINRKNLQMLEQTQKESTDKLNMVDCKLTVLEA